MNFATATRQAITLPVTRLVEHAVLPVKAHHDDAGFDLASAEDVTIQPGARAVVGTGIALALPPGWSALVCPRSGLAAKHGISVVNGPGIIDTGYRGEIRVVLVNLDQRSPFVVRSGDRIAQLLLLAVPEVVVSEVATLPSGTRAERGFGSTGIGAGGTD